jgi:hypothetical protein
MSFLRKALTIFLFGVFTLSVPSVAQDQENQSTAFPNFPGRDVLMARCLQCHGTGMWKDNRQDRRGWESVLYRMVGRGALWTEEDIRTMAGYLAAAYGPQASKPTK